MNEELLLFLNNIAQTNETVKKTVYVFADTPIFFLPLFLIIYWVYYSCKKNNHGKEKLLLIFYSTVLAVLISVIIQSFVNIDRPESYLQSSSHLIMSHLPDASFPSDHASVSFAFLASLLLFGYKIEFYLLIPFLILMNVARIMVGVHWPYDILAGVFVGVLSGLIVFRLLTNNKVVKKTNLFIIRIASFIKL